MNKVIAVIVIILTSVTLLNNCTVSKNLKTERVKDSKSPLAEYGEHIFNRESCINCHTLNIQNETSQLISLDGVGGKYASSWLYYYLNEPQDMFPESRKNGFSHLSENLLNRNEPPTKQSENKKEANWTKINAEADKLIDGMVDYNIQAKRSEMIALIAYIQTITGTKAKLKIDSLNHVKYVKEQELWENDYLSDEGIILRTARDTSMAQEGSKVFNEELCTACHGQNGEGMVGPNLTDSYWLNGGENSDIARTIVYGSKNGMYAWQNKLEPLEIGQLVSYINSIKGSNPDNAKAPQGQIEK
jgi:cytochrome c oxidase cbb3-type subunit 3